MRTAITRLGGAASMAGLLVGYLLWLLAFSVVNDNAAAGRWAPIALIVCAIAGFVAVFWGVRQRRSGRESRAAFAFALPIIPLALSLAVVVDVAL